MEALERDFTDDDCSEIHPMLTSQLSTPPPSPHLRFISLAGNGAETFPTGKTLTTLPNSRDVSMGETPSLLRPGGSVSALEAPSEERDLRKTATLYREGAVTPEAE
ncbi:hypothetical protein JEQ12_018766 [Ovis aries]|uniref:Uncharacterized protein n=1 Tax=Ovis aries TaxID=9940 RepID=A0A836D362_SHEEP|nr:hypothetical protein JEQ12_018766 [Ovis aries]